VPMKGPSRLIRIKRRQSSSDVFSMDFDIVSPTLLTRMSRLPALRSISDNVACQLSGHFRATNSGRAAASARVSGRLDNYPFGASSTAESAAKECGMLRSSSLA
jgi:hypothetical protein